MEPDKAFCTVEEAAGILRGGGMVLVTDDEHRENEGDLVAAAAGCTPQTINFMATHGRGLICVPMEADRLRALGLERMVPPDERDRYRTAFTVTVDARVGTTTGISAADRALMGKAPFDEEAYKRELGVRALKGERGYTTKERTGIRPCLDVCGIWGGYTGEGTKTVLPSKAYAKISTRLVANQDFEKVSLQFKEYFESVAPDYVTVKVTPCHGGAAYATPLDTKAYRAAERAMQEVYGRQPIPTRSGGSIPIVAGFERILGIKSILMGFGLASDDIHAPNENYPLEQFFHGIETIPLFYKHFAE